METLFNIQSKEGKFLRTLPSGTKVWTTKNNATNSTDDQVKKLPRRLKYKVLPVVDDIEVTAEEIIKES